VATIIAVEPVQNSEKLWKCQVNVGDEQPRQIIAGLQPYISKDVMEGLSAVVICNLKPAKLAGEVSEAMLLAATSTADSSIVRTLQPPEGCKPGDKVCQPPGPVQRLLQTFVSQDCVSHNVYCLHNECDHTQ